MESKKVFDFLNDELPDQIKRKLSSSDVRVLCEAIAKLLARNVPRGKTTHDELPSKSVFDVNEENGFLDTLKEV